MSLNQTRDCRFGPYPWYTGNVTCDSGFRGLIVFVAAVFCAACPSGVATRGRSSAHLHRSVPVEKLTIEIDAKRSGRSLIVRVRGVGKGHGSGERMEKSRDWRVTATSGNALLQQVLAGPAKVIRKPVGAVRGDQWDIEIKFMVAFDLPDQAKRVSVKVQAPSGEMTVRKIRVHTKGR